MRACLSHRVSGTGARAQDCSTDCSKPPTICEIKKGGRGRGGRGGGCICEADHSGGAGQEMATASRALMWRKRRRRKGGRAKTTEPGRSEHPSSPVGVPPSPSCLRRNGRRLPPRGGEGYPGGGERSPLGARARTGPSWRYECVFAKDNRAVPQTNGC